MDDIFLRSFLYGIALLQFLHGDKEMGCSSWHSGFGRTPLPTLLGKRLVYVIKTHIHMLYKENTSWATAAQSDSGKL